MTSKVCPKCGLMAITGVCRAVQSSVRAARSQDMLEKEMLHSSPAWDAETALKLSCDLLLRD